MDPVQIYGLAAGGIFFVLLLYCASSFISQWVQNRTLFFVFKYLIYPTLIQRRRFTAPFTRWHVLCVAVYWSGTAACNLVGVTTLSQAGSRAGALSVLHLIPLFFTDRLSFAADLLGLSLHTLGRLHSSIAVMAFLQGLIHVIIFATHQVFRIKDTQQFHGLLGAIAFVSLIVLPTFRAFFFELVHKCHYAFAALLAYAMWRHLTIKPAFSRFYLFTALATFAATSLARYSRLIFRNVLWRRPYASATSGRIRDSLCVKITVPRPWKVRAGQYVYIWAPEVSFWSRFESHPFVISWWDDDIQGRGSNIYLFVRPKSGFTRKLVRYEKDELKVWVDGPYGTTIDAADYGSVLMFASGIGIAAQVPYIKEIIREYKAFRARTKRILLVWEVDERDDRDWTKDWFDELLNEDNLSYILEIRLYVLGGFTAADKAGPSKFGDRGCMWIFYGDPPNLQEIIRSEIEKKPGRLLITTSAECGMQDKVQELANDYLDKDVRLEHLAFRPRNH